MDKDKKLEFIENELNDHIRRMMHNRRQDKLLAFGCKIVAVCFGATITILLGLKVDGTLTDFFRNIALVLGGMITIVSAFDAFFNFRYLWVKRTVMLIRLLALRRDVAFYTLNPEQGESHMQKLDGFMDRLKQLLEDELNDWFKLRESDSSQIMPQISEDK